MFIVSFILLVLGIFCFGIAFDVPNIPALVFVLGILLVSAALAIPVHFGGTSHKSHSR